MTECEIKDGVEPVYGWYGHPVVVEFTEQYIKEVFGLRDVVKQRKLAHNLFDVQREFYDGDGKVEFSVRLEIPFHGNGGIEAYTGDDVESVPKNAIESAFRSVLREKLVSPYVKSYDIIDIEVWLENKRTGHCKIDVG
jgi:hypothetical protein